MTRSAGALTQALQAQAVAAADRVPHEAWSRLIQSAAQQLATSHDAECGGFGGAPKFPPCGALLLLLRVHDRERSEATLAMVRGTRRHMAEGGLYARLASLQFSAAGG